MLSKDDYKYESWGERFSTSKVDLGLIEIDGSWEELLAEEREKEYFERLNRYLSKCLRVTSNKIKIYPYPNLVFNSLNLTPFEKIKVVILGQDPYHNNELVKDKIVPQAMGLSFSIPVGIPLPSSLSNIFKNLIKFDHIKEKPDHGNLESWADQGCLMLNTSLTVQHGYPNSHSKFWKQFTCTIISKVSRELDNVVFLLWGSPALEKLKLIDTSKHKTIISSHPSGLSCNKPLRSYKPFLEEDHFGKTNKFLIKNGYKPIDWNLN